jgi:hypothetical protein
MQGNGAGFQNGTTGQLSAFVYDPDTLDDALFDMQGWQDSADASYASLLEQLLNGQLGLRLEPWELIAGDPIARQRRANTWPITGAVAEMRWRPGDGVRVQAEDINVYDTTPRQLLLVTRQIQPTGIISTQVGFAARPKSGIHGLTKAIKAALRPQRNYQRQLVALTGSIQDLIVLTAGTLSSAYSMISLSPGDQVVRTSLRINYNLNAGLTLPSGQPLRVFVNGVDETGGLQGPWTTAPINLDIGSVANPDQFSRVYVQLKNAGGSTLAVSWQLFVDVLR